MRNKLLTVISNRSWHYPLVCARVLGQSLCLDVTPSHIHAYDFFGGVTGAG